MTKLTTLSFSLAAMLGGLSLNNSADAQHAQSISCLAGEIRAQMAVVDAQAQATLGRCDEYEDVQEELEELCEDMSRFEALLADPLWSERHVRRLGRAARRVDEQVCEVREEIDDALEDLHDDRPAFRRPIHPASYQFNRGPVQYSFPPRYVPASQFGFTTVSHQGPISYRSGGITLTLGSSSPRIRLVSGPEVLPAPSPRLSPWDTYHRTGRPAYRQQSIFQQQVATIGAVRHNAAAEALCSEATQLRSLTRQLVRLLCH